MSSRVISHVYLDPIDAIWLQLAREIGWRVERSAEVYASTDGDGQVWLGTPETLDPDDCVAQMIFHEICHACVQGELGRAPDWGLDNTTERDVPREHACLRLQASLADEHGLREVLAPTTDFRVWYDAIDTDPFGERDRVGDDLSVALAVEGARWLDAQPWAPRLREALARTAEIARLVRGFGAGASRGRPLLWSRLESPTKGSQTGK